MHGEKIEETHISWVIVGLHFTYKIKKPVKFNFLDFSTLEKRKHFCNEEIKLNQRYSPSIYLKVMPISINGSIVDYAVKMKTLPPEKRLDKLITKNKATPSMIKKIAEEIWHFHSKAKASDNISNFGKPDHLRKIYNKDFNSLSHFVGKNISGKEYGQLYHFMNNFLINNKTFFLSRIKEKAIRDRHGDLHSENIFYHNKPYIFDCIEFNPNFRYIDSAAEISFLVMDLEFRKKEELAKIFLNAYLNKSKDYDLLKLLTFYKCHYACVEGLVNILSGNYKKAKEYFKLALRYTKPYLIAVGGIIGTGKSTLAMGLAEKLGAFLLRSDIVRKKLAKVPLYDHSGSEFNKSIYSKVFTQKTYQALFSSAVQALGQGQNVVLDASFSKKHFRKQLVRLAQRNNVDFLFIETSAPDKIILKQLKQRKREISDAGSKLLAPFKKSYEAPEEIPVLNRFRIKTIGKKENTLKKALARINARINA